MALTPEAVLAVFGDCVFVNENASDPDEECIAVEGFFCDYEFDPDKIKENTQAIAELTAELPGFFEGGMSFLLVCMDNNGNQWVDDALIMEALVVLGLATGHIEWLVPRDEWHSLPGGYPYIAVNYYYNYN